MSLLERIRKNEETKDQATPTRLDEVRERLDDQPAPAFVPAWRRRQIEELEAAGGRLVASKELAR